MDSNLAKCFICDVVCVAKCTNQGSYIAQSLTMPLISVLTKCLRTFVEVENEYFCCDCVRKIKEYDNLAKLSLQIEADLYRQFQSKPFRTGFLDDEFIVDQSEIRDFFNFKQNLSSANDNTQINKRVDEIDLTASPIDSIEKSNESTDIMIVKDLARASTENVQSVENDAVEIEQLEQLELDSDEPEIDDNVFPDNFDTKSNDDDDYFDDVKSHSSNAAAEQNVPPTRNKQTNIVKRRKKRKVRKANNNNNNDNSQSGDSLWSCDICGRSYKSKGALGTHMVKHSDQNPHGCEICGKVFTQRLGLLRHIPIHTGEQQYQCHICGKRFIHSASYNMHKKMHLDERSKKCDICGSEFRSSSHYVRHKRTHTGERPFECEICGQKFSQRYNMKTHRNTHHKVKKGTKNFKCLICPENVSFVRRDKLNDHLRQVHEMIAS